MKIYLASGNKNKKREMSQILSPHQIVTPDDEGIIFSPIENGKTFYENSIIKAKDLYEKVACPVIADDSGICVDALSGIPGIFSARYAGPEYPQGKADGSKISQEEQNKFLIQQLNDTLANGNIDTSKFKNGPRSAHYTCAMVLYMGHDRVYVVQDTMEGCIINSIEEAAGTGGFGYDPIFFLPDLGVTSAQLSAEEKNKISHRGKATRCLLKIMESINL
ncbi:MAG: non-canonical purine NTP pyrophosphatase [Treponema sp.]|nr:non-canonical purine NTP pyrophosphatase [Treponema sp.]